MVAVASAARTQAAAPNLPSHRDPYYAGKWQKPKLDRYIDTISPGTGESLGKVVDGSAADIDAAIAAAKAAFREWRRVPPLERAKMLRAHRRRPAQERRRARDDRRRRLRQPSKPRWCATPRSGAAQIDFFAGLVTEMKGASIPMGPDAVNFSVREPLRRGRAHHPVQPSLHVRAGKSAAPLAAGNTIVVKPPEQAPLSSLRLAELIDGIFPPGVFNVVPGGREAGRVWPRIPTSPRSR